MMGGRTRSNWLDICLYVCTIQGAGFLLFLAPLLFG
jgi:hypothetical protein